MTENSLEKTNRLIEEGKSFTYENFASSRSSGGYPASISPEYAGWKAKVDAFLAARFGKSGAIYETFKKGDNIEIIGWGAEHFLDQISTIIGALLAAIDILENIPTSKFSDLKVIDKSNSRVFIVHGHDDVLKSQLEIFLAEIGLEPIVLHRKADEGLTIIEKFEKHSDVGYAFILLTPDDVGYTVSEDSLLDTERQKEKRARQNVIFEFGYFVAKLGRQRVCCLYKEGVTLPTDISGILYKKVNIAVEEVAFSILKDIKAAGYIVSV